jgi:hypothetical protein
MTTSRLVSLLLFTAGSLAAINCDDLPSDAALAEVDPAPSALVTKSPGPLRVLDWGVHTLTKVVGVSPDTHTCYYNAHSTPGQVDNGRGKLVGLRLRPDIATKIDHIALTYWDAGHRAQATTNSVVQDWWANLSSLDDNDPDFIRILPGSAAKVGCDGMYYFWTVSYRDGFSFKTVTTATTLVSPGLKAQQNPGAVVSSTVVGPGLCSTPGPDQ